MDYATPEARVAELVEHELQPASRRSPEPPAFSGVERSVIQLSRKDSLASIPELWDWRVGVARLFAANQANPLANARLEELRRFAILVRVHDDPGDDAIDRFLDAGYTVEQAGLVRRILQEGVPARRGAGANGALWAVLLLIAVGIYVVMQHAVGEIAISLIAAGLGFVTIASLTAPHRRTRY